MRIHLSQQAMQVYRDPNVPAELRQAIQSLRINQKPEWARCTPERPNRYEFPISSYWIVYEIDNSGSETVIKVEVIEE